ncbi:radical SAM family heme chaperone HemW [Desulfobulbus alkaliphilus]|uniref:radical SAM family heme chaperone HemW n=1 Tax=Desulfobulbus alkaliphilus TaxID=869814 RepID=UPI001962362C|nr:radical SAM family heme chaperone HemW [Desulfobulbus alkaliphilus]MBM9537273.1 radical SAM family heme chaperone HemW [Desulfobulbus alkaliphilus]
MELSTRAGLYVHVPFCRGKCPYCSFYSFPPAANDVQGYVEAVRLQMRQWANLPEVQRLSFVSIFFGGGTPSILPVEALELLLGDCQSLFTFSTEPEITIETNPATIDGRGLEQLRRIGFNRISIGVQSFNDRELVRLGRLHTGGEALTAIASARRAGFTNLSLDLMYGLPGQSQECWQQNLEQALAVVPEHLSLYELTVEDDTPLAFEVVQKKLCLPTEDEILAMMAAIEKVLATSPLARYEISNYAVVGKACRHNLNYWDNGEYLGLGPGAVSAFGGQRRSTVSGLDQFCRRIVAGETLWDETEELSPEAAFRETVIMGLRLLAGISMTGLRRRFGIDVHAYYGETLSSLLHQNLLTIHGDNLLLTRSGLPLANRVMAKLV